MSANEAYQNNRQIELKCWLIRRGLSQPKLARRLGITRQYLSQIFKGERRASSVRRRLVDEIGIPAEFVDLDREAA